ncbi:MAG: hypothetical protein ACRDQC_14705, partial [Gaiellales bacterium]
LGAIRPWTERTSRSLVSFDGRPAGAAAPTGPGGGLGFAWAPAGAAGEASTPAELGAGRAEGAEATAASLDACGLAGAPPG